MNRKLLVLLMVTIALPAAATQYVKPGAVLTLNPGKGNAEFNINASTGMIRAYAIWMVRHSK